MQTLRVVNEPDVRVVDSTPDGERAVLAGVSFSLGAAWPENDLRAWQSILKDMGPHDSPPREFELASITFEACMSASCFAQLKRHRMMTLLVQPYDPALGVVMPPAVHDAGLDEDFTWILKTATENACRLGEEHSLLASYLLTNTHRRRVLMKANARELYHVARLRCDEHAQWEIRLLAGRMVAISRELWPHAMALACGKHEFERCYAEFFRER